MCFRDTYVKAIEGCTKRCLEKVTGEQFVTHQKRIKRCYDGLPLHEQRKQHEIEMRMRLHSEMKKQVIKNTKQRVGVTFEETINVGEFEESLKLCENCFVHIHDEVCLKTYANWKNGLKKELSFDSVGSNLLNSLSKANKVKDSSTKHYANIVEARAALSHLDLDELSLHLTCLPSGPGYLQAYHWMSHFFEMVGDYAPNRDNKVQLPGIYTKTSIHSIYAKHIESEFPGDEHSILSKSRFLNLWANVFPNVTVTKFCQVTGKCSACHWLYERQEVFRSEKELETIKEFASIHKIMIYKERGMYVHKRQLAQEHPELYMSLIVDGMSQDHCILPYCGNKVAKNNPLKQKIIGAKQHGFSRTFYRAFPHVSGGSNLAIEVLLQEIEKRMEYCLANNKLMPDVLFLQIDGGPENTSKTFYAMLDQLVKLGVFKKIEVCRLPVGHTHEDIDALFGTLWKASQHKTLITPQEWKRMALETFSVA